MNVQTLESMLDRQTRGVEIPVVAPRATDIDSRSECTGTAQLIGTVHNHRGRWNPFLAENNMAWNGTAFTKDIELFRTGGRHGDGVYAFRFVRDHELARTFKADHSHVDEDGQPRLMSGPEATAAHNIMIRVVTDGIYTITFDPNVVAFNVSPRPEYLTTISSIQLNGFVWDDEDMFRKFDETRPTHEMTLVGQAWELSIPLRADGGISFRKDGVYQFLFSANHNEDWGFGGDNRALGRLSGGTGFGSSGGGSIHSAVTIKVWNDGVYTIRMNPSRFEFEVVPPNGAQPPDRLNRIDSMQLLGSIYSDRPYDPTLAEHGMDNVGSRAWVKTVDLAPGIYSINFAISQELFLDTMALGAWIATSDKTKLAGRAWHGKPSEPNVLFEVLSSGSYRFTYDGTHDEFTIEPASASEKILLRPITTIDSVQLVGNFEAPLVAWDPRNPANDMKRPTQNRFERDVELIAGQTYSYKYTANHLPWLWVFADYELDGYGEDFRGRNPDVLHSALPMLKRYGHLTTHGDPPALQITPQVSGLHKFIVDLETGAYSVHPISQA